MNHMVRINPAVLAVLLIVALLIGGAVGIVAYPQMRAIPQGDTSIWLQSPLSQSNVETLKAEIAAWPEVKRVVYVSETLRMERLESVAGLALLNGSRGNPFGPSFVLSLRSPLAGHEIMTRLQTKYDWLGSWQVNSKF